MDLNEHFGRNRLFMEYNEECFLEHTHPQIEVFFLMNASLKMICFRDQSIFEMSHNKCLFYYNHKFTKLWLKIVNRHIACHFKLKNVYICDSISNPTSVQ